ncbi:MAG: RNA polymerase sigma factor [Chloroflexota bacterium]
MHARQVESPATDADDGALVAGCLAGDDAAWHALISRYARLVEAVLRRYHLPPEEQADAFQDVWVALWREMACLRNTDRLEPWLITTAGRTAWDARKRIQRRMECQPVDQLADVLTDESTSPELAVTTRETTIRVQAALAQVSPRCRMLIKALFFEETISYAKIAGQLGCSANSIGPIRGRCFRELRDALAHR